MLDCMVEIVFCFIMCCGLVMVMWGSFVVVVCSVCMDRLMFGVMILFLKVLLLEIMLKVVVVLLLMMIMVFEYLVWVFSVLIRWLVLVFWGCLSCILIFRLILFLLIIIGL